jgi:hypothetical protein
VVTSMSTGMSSSKGIASMIISSISPRSYVESGANIWFIVAGASQTSKGSRSSSLSSSAAFSSPAPVTTSAGGRVGSRSYLLLMWAVFCTGLGLVLRV